MTSKSCIGEKCFCGRPAAAKVEETIFHDDWSMVDDGPMGGMPREMRGRHPLTSYVCAPHFAQIMHNSGEPIPYEDKPTAIIHVHIGRNEDGSFPALNEAEAPITSVTIRDLRSYQTDTYLVQTDKLDGTEFADLHVFQNETDMLRTVADVLHPFERLMGWNIVALDIPYLVNRTSRICPISVQMTLGRGEMPVAYQWEAFGRDQTQFTLKDCEIVDLLYEYKRKFTAQSYRLQNILISEKIDLKFSETYTPDSLEDIRYAINSVECLDLLARRHGMFSDTTFRGSPRVMAAKFAAGPKLEPLTPLRKHPTSPKLAPTRIKVTRHGKRWRAAMADDDDQYAEAKSEAKAVGRLMLAYSHLFNTEIEPKY